MTSHKVKIRPSDPSGDDKTWLINFTTSGTLDSLLLNSSAANGDFTLPNDNYTLTVNHSNTSGAGAPASNQTYVFTRMAGDYLGGGSVNSADLLLVVQNYNRAVPAGMWFMDKAGSGTINSAELLGIVQNFNHGFTNTHSLDPILEGASQTAGVGSGRIAAQFVPPIARITSNSAQNPPSSIHLVLLEAIGVEVESGKPSRRHA